jgi:hypothetical protein
MRIVRAALVAFIALSVAALPVAGAEMRVFSPDMSFNAAQPECCPQGQHCEKQAKGDCRKSAACALKCSSFSAATAAPSGLTLVPSPLQQTTLVAEIVRSPSVNPPLPPPRV